MAAPSPTPLIPQIIVEKGSDLPAWIQAGSASAIVVLTAVLVWATISYARQTKKLVQATEATVNEMRSDRVHREKVDSRRAAEAIVELLKNFDSRIAWIASPKSAALVKDIKVRAGALHDDVRQRALAFVAVVSTARSLVRDTGKTLYGQPIPQPALDAALNRVEFAVKHLRQSLDAHRRDEPIPANALPSTDQAAEWLRPIEEGTGQAQ